MGIAGRVGAGVLVGIVALAVGAVGPAGAAAPDPARGRALYALCATCHGAAGEGDASRGAPSLAGLEPWYVEAQLRKFRDGWRGYHADDLRGLQMRPMAATVADEDDLRSVVAYVATLPRTAPAPTLDGDAERGRAAYAPCVACHGQAGEGNEALKAPALAGHADWYTARQIENFQRGVRGAHPEDATGAQMRAMAATLVGEQAIADVAVFLATLGR